MTNELVRLFNQVYTVGIPVGERYLTLKKASELMKQNGFDNYVIQTITDNWAENYCEEPYITHRKERGKLL